jgi:hypothetical protein
MKDQKGKRFILEDNDSFPPQERKEPLPWSAPKPREEDPDAPERIRRIMENPSYRRADQDLDLLKRDELRPTRLELEFLKPELTFLAGPASSNRRQPNSRSIGLEKLWPNTLGFPSSSIVWMWRSGFWPRAIIMMWLANSVGS